MDAVLDPLERDSSTRLGKFDMTDEGARGSFRPIARGARGAVATGHLLASMAGYDMLRRGGNAADAGVAAGLCQCVVEHDRASLGGVAPLIYFEAETGTVHTVSGLGRWPKAASLDYFERHHGGKFPPGMSTAITPLAMDAWLLALQRFGTLSFEAVAEQALRYCVDGFPVSEVLWEDIAEYMEGFKRWPATAAVFLPDGQMPAIGDLLRQPALANTFRRLIAVERQAASNGREGAIQALRDFFYRGEMGEELIGFCKREGGLLTMDDMREAEARIEPPVSLRFGDYELFACGPWTQGPVLLQALAILKGIDLKALGHNSVAYVHTVAEAVKLAFADRDAFYGDPDFVDVPLAELLSEPYSAARRALIDPDTACPTMPPFGTTKRARGYFGRIPPHEDKPAKADAYVPDTTVGTVIDARGNIFASAPSDPAFKNPIDDKLGFGISPRGTQSWLHPNHPSVLAPGKRPRLTTNPILALKNGRPSMALCTPGGDVQPQANLQVFLNITVFGMNVQQAVEAPRFTSFSFPNSFYPHFIRHGELTAEARIGDDVIEALARKGHKVRRLPAWSGNAGAPCVIVRDEAGVMHAGADPRRDAYAVAF
jgi:gamma-glutamyltranspeptidase/glutathione hydrolase